MTTCEYCGKEIRKEGKRKRSAKQEELYCPGDVFCKEYNTRWFLITIQNTSGEIEKFLASEVSLKNRGNIEMRVADGNISFSVAYFDQVTIEPKKIPEAMKLSKNKDIMTTLFDYVGKKRGE